ncbi:hypothetical protein HG264_16590 [Pseudomonas sp. gcc21]|uniref:hypothetical protein n=1 Tax=Pseudomonas sp. gcc21 TaxID=2726989 RepID=UPI00145116C3|nr:hypothetical protein [Pseudomonas sp. gcc21]QJD60376.1 hypothetical protein HG264_16590 [Pseudomonas sp. gcc21]
MALGVVLSWIHGLIEKAAIPVVLWGMANTNISSDWQFVAELAINFLVPFYCFGLASLLLLFIVRNFDVSRSIKLSSVALLMAEIAHYWGSIKAAFFVSQAIIPPMFPVFVVISVVATITAFYLARFIVLRTVEL